MNFLRVISKRDGQRYYVRRSGDGGWDSEFMPTVYVFSSLDDVFIEDSRGRWMYKEDLTPADDTLHDYPPGVDTAMHYPVWKVRQVLSWMGQNAITTFDSMMKDLEDK